jgi:hypothetical protein
MPAGRLPTPSPFPFRCRHQSSSQPKPLFASTEHLLPRNDISIPIPTTPPPGTDHPARYIGRFRRVVLTLGRSLPRPLTCFLIPERSIRRSPSISLSRRHEGATSAADHYLIIILPVPAPGGYTDRDRANGSCSPPFDQPFFTLKLVVLRGIAGCPRCPSVHPWKMEVVGKE